MNIVKELRKKKGIQQKQLAFEIGVACPTVSEWETGKKDPSGERLKKLAEYFQVDELEILGTGAMNHRVKLTEEAEIISGAIDQMPKEERQKILNVFKIMYPNVFDKDSK